MGSSRKTLGAALGLIVATGWVAADDEIRPREALAPATAKLEALIRRVMEGQDLPAVSIALVDGSDVVWAKGFGLARPKEKIAATAETVYRVGSVSKLFTDLALMQPSWSTLRRRGRSIPTRRSRSSAGWSRWSARSRSPRRSSGR